MTSSVFLADSILEITGDSDQVAVYGCRHCLYENVENVIKEMTKNESCPIRRVFNYNMGNSDIDDERTRTLEGTPLNDVDFEETNDQAKKTARLCKASLTNLVMENYRRNLLGKSAIPMLFCIDIDDNPKPWSPERICSKEARLNKSVTHKELRRAYKLCTHSDFDVRLAAEATFRFVKVNKLETDGITAYSLKEIAAPWMDSSWETEWNKRKLASSTDAPAKTLYWKDQVDGDIEMFHMQMGPSALSETTSMEKKEQKTL